MFIHEMKREMLHAEIDKLHDAFRQGKEQPLQRYIGSVSVHSWNKEEKKRETNGLVCLSCKGFLEQLKVVCIAHNLNGQNNKLVVYIN